MSRPHGASLARALSRLAAVLTLLLVLAGPARAALPLALTDTSEPVGPGVVLQHQQYLESTGWIDRQVLTVDLRQPSVTTDLVHAPAVAQGSPLSSQLNAVHDVAGVNGDFFDIGNSNASLGFEIASGRLRKSGTRNSGQAVGVSDDGIGQLTNLALAAKATWAGADHGLSGLNQVGVPTGGIGACTSEWGDYPRATQLGTATNTAEVWVADGKVSRVAAAPGAGTLPAGTTALDGRDAGADALRALALGDPVAISYAVAPDLAARLRFALGTDVTLVRDGVQRPDAETAAGASGGAIAPRTAIGFKDGGHTMILMTVDGPGGTGAGGVTLPKLAQMMVEQGAQTAVNLDGGGSTTMVARGLGEPLATVRNVPSDGQERLDPNGVGVGVTPGDGQVEELVVTPAGDDARVFPGLTRLLTAKGIDDHQYPVALARDDVRWRASGASVDNGLVHAPAEAADTTLDVRATSDGARADTRVRVLGPLDGLELSSRRLAFPDTSTPSTVSVSGRDGEGFAAPIEFGDLDLSYDPKVVKLQPAPRGMRITPVAAGGTLIRLSVGDEAVTLPVTVGVQTRELYRFDHDDEASRWTTTGTAGAAKALAEVPEGLKLSFAAQRNMGIAPAMSIDVPGQPLRIRIKLLSSVQTEFTSLYWTDATGATKNRLVPGPVPGANAIDVALPSDTKFPIKISQLQVVETNTTRQAPGEVSFQSIEADTAPEVTLPAPEPLRADPLVSPDGRFAAKDDWTFATLSDVQFTAADPELAKVGVAALERIRRRKPDLVVLNGDITDLGAPEDIALARRTLEQGGCDIVRVGQEPAPESTPDPASGKVPCYYVPGNHESYRASGQGDIAPFVAEFGQPYRTFDHKGTRFILLNSSLGTLRSSDFAQLPLLEQALDSARTDPSIRNVLVFAHHPVDDPEETKDSQLADRREVALVERLLSDFRSGSGKGVAMVGSHAQVVNVHRIEGVPYTVLPSSGKAPYGTPDRGGFTGYLDWSVDRDADARGQWLTADVNAFAQSITLTAPDTVEVGTAAPIGGTVVQPSGVKPGTRVVPLAYPMSVHFSGDDGLALGSGREAIDAARRAGKTAILDPATRLLTGLRTGTVSVRVSNESMREFTGADSLQPVTAEQRIAVVPDPGDGPRLRGRKRAHGTAGEVTVRCTLVHARRGVSCTVSASAGAGNPRLRATLRFAGDRRSAGGTGTHRVTLRLLGHRRVSSRQRLLVSVTVGHARAHLVAHPDAHPEASRARA